MAEFRFIIYAMKNIAVFVHSFSVEYSDLVINGIHSYFENCKDVRVYFAQTSHPHYHGGVYDYMHWASFEYFKSKSIDEVIVVSNSYSVYMAEEKIREVMSPLFVKKFISIGFDLLPGKTYYAITSCDEPYNEIINFLKNKQGCTKIAFYSANLQKTKEAQGRYAAFKKGLQKNGLEFHEEWVFDGDYTSRNVKQNLYDHYKTKEEIPFEAIISANDQMGMAVLDYFAEIGVNVPQEMKVFGLDNTIHSILSDPTLATIDQNIEELGRKVAEFGMNLLNKDSDCREHGFSMPMKVIYRRSCGCEDYNDNKKRAVFNGIIDKYRDFNRLRSLFDLLQGTSTVEKFIDSFKMAVSVSGLTSITIYALRDTATFAREDEIKIPHEARPLLHIDTEKDVTKYYGESDYFDIRNDLFSREFTENEPGRFLFQPMFLKGTLYGYIVCSTNLTDFTLNNLIMRIISSVAVQVFGYTNTILQKEQLEIENKKLSQKAKELDEYSKTDELTKILNRRGFMEYGQRLIHFSADVESEGCVIFADLDGLKYINDNFGHEYGDKAIKTEANIIRQTFRKMDIVGRLSGDEFAIVASGMELRVMEKIRKKIDDLNKKATAENNFPFELSISLGAAEFNKENTNLPTLLKAADNDLYKQKEIHHARIKKTRLPRSNT